MVSLRVSVCLILTLVPAVGFVTSAEAKPRVHRGKVISGSAYALDGDTIVIGEVHVRLFGADAFESDQSCGQMACGPRATAAMEGLIAKQVISCEKQDTDRYGRTVAICKTSGGIDLGREMVRRGLAVAYRRYSVRYLADEQWAKDHREGAWAHGFDSPVTWRQKH